MLDVKSRHSAPLSPDQTGGEYDEGDAASSGFRAGAVLSVLSRGCTRAFRGASLHRPRAGKELKGDSRAPTLACPSDTTAAADGQAPASGSAGKAAALQGTYRVSLTEKELADSPLLSDQGEINDQNWGQLTLKLSDAR
jgi:hypothetical protein